MENIIRGGSSVIMAHLKHLSVHGEKDLLNQAIAFLKERNIDVPDYENGESFSCACPGSVAVDLSQKPETENEPQIRVSPELRNWPVQLQLLNPNAPYFKNADLLISADCAPFAYADFHQEFLKNKVLIILCPKLDKTIDLYVDKLAEIFQKQDVNSISIVHMEVPCCSGIEVIVRKALKKAQKDISIIDYTVSTAGEIIQTK